MKIINFCKQYKDYRVKMVDIDSEKRIILLKGDNGSGKSTLLKAVNNLITYNGEIISKGTKSYMNEMIKFPKDMTVTEVINAFNSIDEASKKVVSVLIDQFDLFDKINDRVSSLSKGMKMKLQLLCTFLIDCDIYILDEPFSGLDEKSVIRLINFILSSSKKFIIASHIEIDFKDECQVILV